MPGPQGIASSMLQIMDRIKYVVGTVQPPLIPDRNVHVFSDPITPENVNTIYNTAFDESAMLIGPGVDAFRTEPRFSRRLRVTYHVDLIVWGRILDKKRNPTSLKVMATADSIYQRLMYHDLRKMNENAKYLRNRTGGNIGEFSAVSVISSMVHECTMRFFGEKDIFV